MKKYGKGRKPEDRPISDMCKAFQMFCKKRYEVYDYVKNDHLFPLDIEPDRNFEISYSQPAQALRIIDRKLNMCITAVYNAYDPHCEDFVDMVFYRPLNASEDMHYGVMIDYRLDDGSVGFGVPEPYKSKADLFLKGVDGKSKLLTYDEDAIMCSYAEALMHFRTEAYDNNGDDIIKRTHQDEYLIHIPPNEWESTPLEIKQLYNQMIRLKNERNSMEERLDDLQEEFLSLPSETLRQKRICKKMNADITKMIAEYERLSYEIKQITIKYLKACHMHSH